MELRVVDATLRIYHKIECCLFVISKIFYNTAHVSEQRCPEETRATGLNISASHSIDVLFASI